MKALLLQTCGPNRDRNHKTFLAEAFSTAFEPGSLANSSRAVSIFSRVSRVSLSTSAAVRPLVGIGGRTIAVNVSFVDTELR
jgi:hypothetical protein